MLEKGRKEKILAVAGRWGYLDQIKYLVGMQPPSLKDVDEAIDGCVK